jgi:hypothetical protein
MIEACPKGELPQLAAPFVMHSTCGAGAVVCLLAAGFVHAVLI